MIMSQKINRVLSAIRRRIYQNNYLLFFNRQSKKFYNKKNDIIYIDSISSFDGVLANYEIEMDHKVNVINQINKGSKSLLYISDGKVSGYLFFTQNKMYTKEIYCDVEPSLSSVYIYHILVIPSCRGTGVQSYLMSSVDGFVDDGIELYISVLSNNFFSLKNIINNGFKLDGFVHVLFFFGFKKVLGLREGGLNVNL